MTARKTLLGMIEERMLCPVPIGETSKFYTDLGFDSLSFTGLLVEIEDTFSIDFSIDEMHACFQVDTLMAAVEKKLEEKGSAYD